MKSSAALSNRARGMGAVSWRRDEGRMELHLKIRRGSRDGEAPPQRRLPRPPGPSTVAATQPPAFFSGSRSESDSPLNLADSGRKRIGNGWSWTSGRPSMPAAPSAPTVPFANGPTEISRRYRRAARCRWGWRQPRRGGRRGTRPSGARGGSAGGLGPAEDRTDGGDCRTARVSITRRATSLAEDLSDDSREYLNEFGPGVSRRGVDCVGSPPAGAIASRTSVAGRLVNSRLGATG